MASQYHLESVLLGQGWVRDAFVTVADDGHISRIDIHPQTLAPGCKARGRLRRARDAQRAQPCVSARHGGQYGIPAVGARQLLDLAPGDVRVGESDHARGPAGAGDAAVRGNAQVRLHLGSRVPLSAPANRRRPVSRLQRPVGCRRTGRCNRRHRAHVPAHPLPDQRLRRPAAQARAGTLRDGYPATFCGRSNNGSARSGAAARP